MGKKDLPGQSNGPLTETEAERTLLGLLPEDLSHLDDPPETEETSESDADEETASTEDDSENEDHEEDEETSDDEEESKESEDDEEESEEDTEEELPPTFRVKVAGEEKEVTLDELQKGYSRTEDYTRKTQKLAEERRSLEAEQAAIRGERSAYAQRLELLDQAIEAVTPKEPDWEALKKEDPAKYAAAHAEWQQHKQYREQVQAERKRLQEQQTEEAEKQRQTMLAQEQHRLFEALPDLKEDSVRRDLVQFARDEYGYSEQDLSNVVDHRAIVILYESMLYRQGRRALEKGKKSGKVKKDKSGKPMKPSSRPPKDKKAKPNKAAESARKRLVRTGRAADAAAYLEKFEGLED